MISQSRKKVSFTSIEDVCAAISGLLVVALMLITVIDVGGRYLFNKPLMGTVEISELLMPIMVMLAISATQRRNEHVGVDALIDVFKKIARPIYPAFQLFALSVTGLALAFALLYCVKDLISSIGMRETTSGPLYLLMWPAKTALCLGLLLILIRIALQLHHFVESFKTWEVK
jgi:TRAP-type C4-dicarboxylate transport system permease small subunit